VLARISYNSPLVLSFALACTAVMGLSQLTLGATTASFFALGGRATDWMSYWRLLTYPLGHADWSHLVGNLSLVLLVGPSLEERYGARKLLGKMIATAIVSGIANMVLFDTGLLGASGIVFLFIVLSSFANAKAGEIPLTFVLVVILFLSKEIMAAVRTDDVSQFTHLAGGACGAMFGFGSAGRRRLRL
jgi:membrane associated rhomboid family serine protease